MINLTHVKHLYIKPNLTFENSSDLIDFFQQMPRLHELAITEDLLRSLLQCSDLCENLRGRIRTLTIIYERYKKFTIFYHQEMISRFQKTFENIEMFTGGYLSSIEHLRYLMENFSKLSMIELYVDLTPDEKYPYEQLESDLLKCKTEFDISFTYSGNLRVFLWR